MSEVIATDLESYDWPELVNGLNRYLRLRATPIGMKLFTSEEEMMAVPRLRRPKSIHATDQIVGQAAATAGPWASPPTIWSAPSAAP